MRYGVNFRYGMESRHILGLTYAILVLILVGLLGWESLSNGLSIDNDPQTTIALIGFCGIVIVSGFIAQTFREKMLIISMLLANLLSLFLMF